MPASETAEAIRARHWVALYRKRNPVANRWAAGYGSIQHTVETQARVFAMAEMLATQGVRGDGVPLFDVLYAADRVASAALWLVVHQTYARNVYLDGRDLVADDFKPTPEGHTGGALALGRRSVRARHQPRRERTLAVTRDEVAIARELR